MEKHRELVVRALTGGEATGLDVYRKLAGTGQKVWPNHVYALLRRLEGEGLVRGRWERGADGRRRRIYALDEAGHRLRRELERDAVALIMDSFRAENGRDPGPHAGAFRGFLQHLRLLPPEPRNVVVAVPAWNPLACHGVEFRAYATALPRARIHVVLPPGTTAPETHVRISFLDGWRHSMPLKDGFADHLYLQGFPGGASALRTLRECQRVLKPGGVLLATMASVHDGIRPTRATTFAEYAASLFYEHFGEDGAVSVQAAGQTLRSRFEAVQEVPAFGNVYLAARAPAVSPAGARRAAARRARV